MNKIGLSVLDGLPTTTAGIFSDTGVAGVPSITCVDGDILICVGMFAFVVAGVPNITCVMLIS